MILKIIILQIFWFLAVKSGENGQNLIFLFSLLITIANFFVYKPKISFVHYNFILLSFVVFGFIQETLYKSLNLVDYGQSTFPLWLLSLYPVFLCYYGDIFNKFKKISPLLLALIGGLGGVSAFWSGEKISQLSVLSNYYFLCIFISWAMFFLLSLNMFNKLSNQFLSNSGENNV
jgi:hypothetical protein